MEKKFRDLKKLYERYGEHHSSIITYHWSRFADTERRIMRSCDDGNPRRLLDIGAHTLVQSMLFAARGWEVTAADLPFTLKQEPVRNIARDHNIHLHMYESLKEPGSLEGLPSDYYDYVLFSEILEHITFNPVSMWTEIHRCLAPGGRIVVTTPNFYYWRNLYHFLRRVIAGRGAGLSVYEIVHHKETGPHWKEYSLPEVEQYFAELSPDFRVCRGDYVAIKGGRQGLSAQLELLESFLPWFRKNLHVEIRCDKKLHGIMVEPRWI